MRISTSLLYELGGDAISRDQVGLARTQPGLRLYDLGGYPGIVAQAEDRDGVVGEVWSVDDAALKRLDEFEGVHEDAVDGTFGILA